AATKTTASDSVEVNSTGTIRMHNIKYVTNAEKKLVAISRSGEISVIDKSGKEKERYKVPYGAVIHVKDAAKVKAGEVIINWDPHTHPIVSEVAGKVVLSDFKEGITVEEKLDELTGLTSFIITDPKQRGQAGKDLRPLVRIEDKKGNPIIIPGTDVPAQ